MAYFGESHIPNLVAMVSIIYKAHVQPKACMSSDLIYNASMVMLSVRRQWGKALHALEHLCPGGWSTSGWTLIPGNQDGGGCHLVVEIGA